MNVLVNSSAHFGTPLYDGQLWTPNASLGYQFWTRYLDVYDEVRLLARASPYAVPPDGWIAATGPGIVARRIEDIAGPTGYLMKYMSLSLLIAQAVRESGSNSAAGVVLCRRHGRARASAGAA